MKLSFACILLCFFLGNGFAQDLPHTLTEKEKLLLPGYQPPKSSMGFTTPPAVPVRTMAEWEELDGLMIAWTSYTAILRQIVKYAQTECTVYIVCSDSSSVKTYLQSGGVPLTNVKFVVAAFNSVWCRDYGPWSVYANNADSTYIVDWIYNRPRPNDDLVPVVFANQQGIPLYQTTTAPYNLIHTGGNFMTDGQGTGFSSKLILTENPSQTAATIDTIMKKFMGINRYVKMETLPYDQIHHIDMHMKLLDEETLLVGQYPSGVADGPQIEANLQYILANYKTCYGREYKVVRIPMPPDAQGRYPSNSGDYRTYTNSTIVNKTVIVPTYELKHDTTALRIYREAMPGYTVVGIDCNQTIPSLGAIHCITKEIGVREPVFISHAPFRTLTGASAPYQVKAYIKSRSGIQSAAVWWSADTTQGFHQIPLTAAGQDTFTAVIPTQPAGTKVFYYLSATTYSGRTVTKPLTAARGAWNVTVTGTIAGCGTVSTQSGWNLLSIPVRPADSSVTALFPLASSPAYLFSGVYQTSAALSPGKGFWLKFNAPVSHSICGTSASTSIPLTAGWNLIGLYRDSVSTNMLTTTPQGIINSQYYGYNGGYTPATMLQSGKGYWVRASQSGTLQITGTVNAKTNLEIPQQDISSTMHFSDKANNSATLLLTATSLTSGLCDLPPLGPAGMFDVRFNSQSLIAASNCGTATVSISGAQFPVTISLTGKSTLLRDKATSGQLLHTLLQDGGSVTINNPSVSEIEVIPFTSPSRFALEQNYPNPFNPQTKLQFSVPFSCKVFIAVYNSLGQQVQLLAEEEKPAGSYTVQFDGTAFPSGVYYCRMQAGSFVGTQKMLLIK